ncbi:MAG: type II toxin-antitoxin system Phd/YefM family antitoxin [Patescibacteria group bacterium]|nr:type II toxin-antitoxin system Phd/YefM family antitoxin [Patescibacteria group bacterium]
MDTVSLSISQLKANPAQAITAAEDYPVAISSRNKVKAYLVGEILFEKIIEFLEDREDMMTIKALKKSGQWGKGKDLDAVAKELGLA